MPAVLCAVDGTGAAREAVASAIALCSERRLDLGLVGVVAPALGDVQPAFGERVRRFQRVELALIRALREAREAGVETTVAVRAGEPETELRSEAATVGAGELFVPRSRARLIAVLTGRPAAEVERITLAPLAEREVALRPAAA